MLAVKESLREINSHQWLIANGVLLSRRPSPLPDQPSWSDGKGEFFTLSDAPLAHPIPESHPLPETSEFQKVYEAGTISAVWKVGEAFVKVHKSSLDFKIPTVYYHTELEERYIIVLGSLPGQTLGDAWLSIDETARENYARRIAAICDRLTAWKGDTISGVDGNHLSELYLSGADAAGVDNCEPQTLLSSCLEVGMDCSSLVFYHCDLGPGNIIINPEDDSIAIIDWETAGYVPRDWVRTKFHLSSGMDLPVGSDLARRDWRRKVALHLGELGFLEFANKWMSWRKYDS